MTSAASRMRKRSFEDLMDRSSDGTLKLIRKGLSVLGRLNKAQTATAVDLGMASMEDPHVVDKAGATDPLGLPEDESFPAVLAVSYLSRAIGSKESLDQAAQILKKKFSLNEQEVSGIQAVLAALQHRSGEIEEKVERQSLAHAVLPSFEHIRTVVDLRLKITDGSLATFAAVVVALLWTDDDDQKLVFQLSREQLKRLIDELQDAMTEMDEKETWIRNRSK